MWECQQCTKNFSQSRRPMFLPWKLYLNFHNASLWWQTGWLCWRMVKCVVNCGSGWERLTVLSRLKLIPINLVHPLWHYFSQTNMSSKVIHFCRCFIDTNWNSRDKCNSRRMRHIALILSSSFLMSLPDLLVPFDPPGPIPDPKKLWSIFQEIRAEFGGKYAQDMQSMRCHWVFVYVAYFCFFFIELTPISSARKKPLHPHYTLWLFHGKHGERAAYTFHYYGDKKMEIFLTSGHGHFSYYVHSNAKLRALFWGYLTWFLSKNCTCCLNVNTLTWQAPTTGHIR